MYIALFNTRYNRQFEVTISRNAFNRIISKYGYDEGVKIIVQYFFRPKNIKLSTPARRESFRKFVDRTMDWGEGAVQIAPSKERLLKKRTRRRLRHLGKGEYRIRRIRHSTR